MPKGLFVLTVLFVPFVLIVSYELKDSTVLLVLIVPLVLHKPRDLTVLFILTVSNFIVDRLCKACLFRMFFDDGYYPFHIVLVIFAFLAINLSSYLLSFLPCLILIFDYFICELSILTLFFVVTELNKFRPMLDIKDEMFR